MERTPVEKSLDASIKDGAAYALMVGLGETSVGLCALFLGASKSVVALLATIPLFLGACAQLITPLVIDRTRRRKSLVLWGASIQALTWVPMIAAIFTPRPYGAWLLFGGFILYFASVHFGVPAWMSWMGDLVPAAARGRYFGGRTALALVIQFLATAVGGVGLTIYSRGGHEALGFGVVFGGALLARLVSIYYISRMAELPYVQKQEDQFTLWQFLRRLPESNFAKFVLFVACMNAAAHFAGALFIPYWRETLGFSYWEIMLLTTSVLFIQIPSFIVWGRLADRYGNKQILLTTSMGIATLPALWLISTNLVWGILLQLWSGIFWSGFNQSVGNFLLDAVSPAKRARCTAYLNLVMHFGVLVGGAAGAWAIRVVPTDLGFVILPYTFWTILVGSFLLRMSTALVFLPRFREVRDVPEIGVAQMLFHATREATEAAVNVMTGWVRGGEDESEPRPRPPTEVPAGDAKGGPKDSAGAS